MKNNKIHNKWAIRVSSTSEVGAGHFMRCLSIANELVIRSNRVHFFIDSNAAKWKKYSTNLDISFSLASESKFDLIKHTFSNKGSSFPRLVESDQR